MTLSHCLSGQSRRRMASAEHVKRHVSQREGWNVSQSQDPIPTDGLTCSEQAYQNRHDPTR